MNFVLILLQLVLLKIQLNTQTSLLVLKLQSVEIQGATGQITFRFGGQSVEECSRIIV